MVKSESSKDKEVYKTVLKEIEHFQNIVKGHEKILQAIGKL